MSNTILTPTQVTRKALMILHQKLNFIGSINRGYDDAFAKDGAKIGNTLNIRVPNQYTVRTGATLSTQDTTEASVQLQVSTQKGVDVNFTSSDLTLSLDDFSERILDPAMAVLAANIEADAMNMVNDVYQQVNNQGSAIAFSNVLQARKQLVDTPGRADAVAEGGYGGGAYGAGTYGSPRPDTSVIQEASMWSLDTFGQYLEGVMAEDGKIYEWQLSLTTPAQPVANAPTAAALFTSAEGHLVALGAAGFPKRIAWSDEQNNTIWAAAATNTAGDYDIETDGQLMQGLKIRGCNLVFTDREVWTMTATGDNSVYSIEPVGGEGSGAISRNCAAFLDNQAVWMGPNGFWTYNGYVQPLACDLWDWVFPGMNQQQRSKVTVDVNSKFGEVTWRFPSSSSTEIDQTVTWNFRENHWRTGYVVRLSATDGIITQYPMAVGLDGYVYEHEVGYTYDPGVMPYLESGPAEIGEGDRLMDASQLLPDEATQGQVTVTFFTKNTPEDVESSYGPYMLSGYTDVWFSARQARIRYDALVNASWRVGVPRVLVNPGSGR